MSIRVTVKSADLRERTKKGTSEVFAFEQQAFAWLFDRNGKAEEYPSKVTLTIWAKDGKPEHPAYPLGEYTLAPASFTVGDYGRLNVSPRLVPVAQSTRAA